MEKSPNFQTIPDDPFFLLHGENLGVVLVIERLNRDSYHSWARLMSKALSVENKLGFVFGTLKKLANDAPLYSSWFRCNDMVVSWTLNSVMKNLSFSILYIDKIADV